MPTPVNTIEACLFDVGGVLQVSNRATEQAVQTALGVSDHALHQIWTENIHMLGSGSIDEAQFWRRISNRHGTRLVHPDENILGAAYAMAYEPYPQMYDFARTLRDRGIITGILSDTIEPHARFHRNGGHYDGFNPVILSYEVRCRKPGTRIFEYALDRLNMRPDAVAFVDDRYQNTSTARDLGMHAIHCKTPDQAIRDLRSLIFGTN